MRRVGGDRRRAVLPREVGDVTKTSCATCGVTSPECKTWHWTGATAGGLQVLRPTCYAALGRDDPRVVEAPKVDALPVPGGLFGGRRDP